jgi:ureidoglycolate dehydrogenase (NAD+)
MAVISDSELRRFIVALFGARGMSRQNADEVATALLWANLRGADGHGVSRLPRYMEFIDEGAMNVAPAMSVEAVSPSGLRIMADRAPGPVALSFALEQLLPCARQQGVAVAVVRSTTHTGALGFYPYRAAKSGLASIALNATIPLMPYHGAAAASIGTNPIALAVPGGPDSEPLVFDMATSIVALGRLMQARRGGAVLEPGWFVDDKGRPTTDPAAAKMTLPLGGPKGAGLSLMIECFASLLAGNPIVADVLDNHGQKIAHRQNALLVAIDVGRFTDLAVFREQVARLVAALKGLPKSEGTESILMPGERGFAAMARRRQSGIPVPPPLLAELNSLAERYRIEPLPAGELRPSKAGA